MKRYVFKRRQRSPFARKFLLAGIAAGTVVMANTFPVDFPELLLMSNDATAATSPTAQDAEPNQALGTQTTDYLTTGFLDGLLVDRPYDGTPRRATHIPEIADEYI